MVIMSKPERFDAFLPSTPVTEEMRRQVEALSAKENVSKAHIMRSALSLFLAEIVNKTDNLSQQNNTEGGDCENVN